MWHRALTTAAPAIRVWEGVLVAGPRTALSPEDRDRRYARILGFGAYRPSRVVDNAEICRLIDSDDAWIQARSGIVTRRFADSETVAEMAARAASKALSGAGIDPADVSCVMLASMSYLHQAPPAAAACAAELGASGASVLDVGAACAGFTYALGLANALVSVGDAEYVVVVGSERMSDIIDPRDRSTAFLFGDGAGAVVVGPSAEPCIGPVAWEATPPISTRSGSAARSPR